MSHATNPHPRGSTRAIFWDVLRAEQTAGLTLLLCAAFALIAANMMPYQYEHFLHTDAGFYIGTFRMEKHLSHWINDGLMVIFFFLVGLEIKREMFSKGGNLSSFDKAILPLIAAIGGMAIPAIAFWALNKDNPNSIQGWAIPTATDIAFAIGLLAIMGSRVPTALKAFLLALAIFDDLGAIVVIAVFYTDTLSATHLAWALLPLTALALLNYRNSTNIFLYAAAGIILWFLILKSGVHATVAGVITALFIPLKHKEGEAKSLLVKLEIQLFTLVTYAILPIFALANAGVSLKGMSFNMLLEPVTLGIIAGLFFGKQAGILMFIELSKVVGLKMPANITRAQIWGMSAFAGVGFTMALFVSGLSYIEPIYLAQAKVGVLAASCISALWGMGIFYFLCPKQTSSEVVLLPAE